jgi:hypothetical protein
MLLSDESNGFLGRADALAVVDSATDGVGNVLEDLFMMPTVAHLPQGFRAGAGDMLQGPSPLAKRACWGLDLPPDVQVRQALESVPPDPSESTR